MFQNLHASPELSPDPIYYLAVSHTVIKSMNYVQDTIERYKTLALE